MIDRQVTGLMGHGKLSAPQADREGARLSAPTVRRRRLGTKLRELRDDLGLTLEDVAELSKGKVTVAKLSRLELAKSAAKPADVEMLLGLYGAADDEMTSALVDLTREGAQRGWWHSYRGILTPTYEDLISLEAEASTIKTWNLGAVPGLLHTSEYAGAIIRATAMSEAVEAKVDALVAVRLARQSVLTRSTNPLTLWAIIAEGALRTKDVDGEVMYEQLGKLLSMSKRDNVNIAIVQSDAPLHVGQLGSFSLLSFAGRADLDVVHTETLTAALYVEDRDQVAVYRDAMERLTSAAESSQASAELITEIRKAL
ncbi:helix-turn-helix transcriptional regulator [Streptomyces sp. NPDC006512]|uniref:helix-turn-helix domain-containing protein n=1 Tax=Streptomyces sp. NPDC006512 TaxID=3154307 RepID=UPI0033BC0399